MDLDCKVTKTKTDDQLTFTITISNANPLVVKDEELEFWKAIDELKQRINQFRKFLPGDGKETASDIMINQLGYLQGTLARTLDQKVRNRIDEKLTSMLRPICTEAMNWWVDQQDEAARAFIFESKPYREEYKYLWDED